MTYIRRIVGEGGAACQPPDDYSGKQESADYSSKQNSGSGRAVSLQPSLFLQGDMGMEEPHFVLAIYVSAVERQTCDHDSCW